MGVVGCANLLFASSLTRFVPVLPAAGLGLASYFVTLRRFMAQMRDEPRPRWVTLGVDQPLFAHFGASVFALLATPLCVLAAAGVALLDPPGSGSMFDVWQSAQAIAYVCGLALAVWAIWIERRLVRVRRFEVAIRDLPPELAGYRIAQLSDLHVGSFDPKRRALEWVAQCNALEPDLTVVTGDLVTSGTGFYTDVAEALSALRAKDGVFVSMGNHDQANNDQLTRLIDERGPTVLRNASRSIRRDGATFNLVGLDGKVSLADVTRVVKNAANGAPIVLLSHYPWAFEAAAAAGADLILSGHTHGGQLGVPFLSQRLNLARVTGQRSRGLVYSGKTALYVNAGLGTTGPPMRLGVPPEIALITLRRAT